MAGKIDRNIELSELLEFLEIEDYDLLLIGDGSASNWGRECGWSCVSIEKATMARRIWYGAMNKGTVSVAEIMAYLQPLCWYTDRELQRRKKSGDTSFRQVHIITDSQYARMKGDVSKSMPCPPSRGTNQVLWNVFRQFGSHGIVLHWHWVRRETLELNRFVDKLSKAARIAVKEKPPLEEVQKRYDQEHTIYDCNPG